MQHTDLFLTLYMIITKTGRDTYIEECAIKIVVIDVCTSVTIDKLQNTVTVVAPDATIAFTRNDFGCNSAYFNAIVGLIYKQNGNASKLLNYVTHMHKSWARACGEIPNFALTVDGANSLLCFAMPTCIVCFAGREVYNYFYRTDFNPSYAYVQNHKYIVAATNNRVNIPAAAYVVFMGCYNSDLPGAILFSIYNERLTWRTDVRKIVVE